jgi:predicted transcriptional regulator
MPDGIRNAAANQFASHSALFKFSFVSSTQRVAIIEANWFAAAFLMPSGAFSEFLHANNFSIHTAATKCFIDPAGSNHRCSRVSMCNQWIVQK